MNHGATLGIVTTMCAALLVPGSARATDTLIPGKIHIIKDTKLTKMVSKGAFPLPAPGGPEDPTAAGGGLSVFDTDDSMGFSTTLPAGQWMGLGSPAGSKGYKYKGAGTPADPCKVVLVKSAVIKFVCKDDQALQPPALSGTSAIVLSLGTDRYCAEFGGSTIKNVDTLLKRKDATAPMACPSASTTSTTPVTTTTTSTFGPCCGGFTHGVFTSAPAAGNCGTVTDFNGMTFAPIVCGGLYFGGGQNAVPLPVITPDLGSTVVELTNCTVQTATVAPTTSTDTGSNYNCSDVGCYFGAPVPVPNPTSIATSTCLVNTLTTPASGTVDCGLGEQTISIPLATDIYLTGDTATDPGDSIPGIQPCPLCQGGDPMTPASGTCIGGVNDGNPCTPGDTNQGGLAGYPTSNDCLPDPMLSIGTIPIGLELTTGTVSWTAVPATNPSSGTQQRVFCGYCRDADDTGAFQQPFQQCWDENGAVGAPCADPFESCQQRDQGAYGPSGNGVKTITVIGSPAGIVNDGAPHAQELVTNYCVPPTFNPTVDATADLPSAGSLALTGNTELCASANPCPD